MGVSFSAVVKCWNGIKIECKGKKDLIKIYWAREQRLKLSKRGSGSTVLKEQRELQHLRPATFANQHYSTES